MVGLDLWGKQAPSGWAVGPEVPAGQEEGPQPGITWEAPD